MKPTIIVALAAAVTAASVFAARTAMEPIDPRIWAIDSVVYAHVDSVAKLGPGRFRVKLSVKSTLAGRHDPAASPVVHADVRVGYETGAIEEPPKANTRVIVRLRRFASLSHHNRGYGYNYFIPDESVARVPNGAALMEVTGLDDPKAAQIIAALRQGPKSARGEREEDVPEVFLEQLKTAEWGRVPKMMDAARRLLASVQKPDPETPDRLRLIELRHDVTRTFEILAASKPRRVDDPRGIFGTNDPKLIAIRLLGEWRDTDAAYLLAHEIKFTSLLLLAQGPSHPLSCYPAAQALVEIGSPALKVILDQRMAEPITDQELRIFAWVIYLIDGRDLGLARLELKVSELSRSYPKTRLENISRLLEIYKTIDFKDQGQWPRPAHDAPTNAKPVAK